MADRQERRVWAREVQENLRDGKAIADQLRDDVSPVLREALAREYLATSHRLVELLTTGQAAREGLVKTVAAMAFRGVYVAAAFVVFDRVGYVAGALLVFATGLAHKLLRRWIGRR
jgi:hypothetical protein